MAQGTCSVEDCETSAYCRRLCVKHYTRLTTRGSVDLKPRPSAEERFWSYVDTTGDCWEWTGGQIRMGYGHFKPGGQRGTVKAHRFSWQLAFGQIPDGLFVLHHCDNPPCVRPAHLFLGTHLDNMADKKAKGRIPNQHKTHCRRGHPYDVPNTYITSAGYRQCRECAKLNARTYRRRTRVR